MLINVLYSIANNNKKKIKIQIGDVTTVEVNS